MSYQEKQAMVSFITGVLLLGAYGAYTYRKVQAGAKSPDDLQFWAGTMLAFIGLGVVALVVIHIVLHTLLAVSVAAKQEARTGRTDDQAIRRAIEVESVSDEMNKRIELKATRISYVTVGVGFVMALLSLVLGFSGSVMLNIVFLSFFSTPLLQGITQLYFYRRGVGNG